MLASMVVIEELEVEEATVSWHKFLQAVEPKPRTMDVRNQAAKIFISAGVPDPEAGHGMSVEDFEDVLNPTDIPILAKALVRLSVKALQQKAAALQKGQSMATSEKAGSEHSDK